MRPFAVPLAAALLAACSSKTHPESPRTVATAPAATAVVEADAGVTTTPADIFARPGAAPASGSVDGTPVGPAEISGTSLTYANARVRCDVTAERDKRYQLSCRAVAAQPDGSELAAESIADGLVVSWPTAESTGGGASSCVVADDRLSELCSVDLATALSSTVVTVPLKVGDPTHAARIERAVVKIPYSVGIAAGLVPSLPFRYKASAAAGVVGFQRQDYAADELPIGSVVSACGRGADVFFASGPNVYAARKGRVTAYAGSGRKRDTEQLGEPLRLALGTFLGIACGEHELLVADAENDRVLRIGDDDAVSVLAGTGSAGYAGDGGPAAEAALSHPGAVAYGKGGIYLADTGNHAVRKIGADGRIATVVGDRATVPAEDGGFAAAFPLNSPTGVAFGGDGALYVSDQAEQRLLRIGPDLAVATLSTRHLVGLTAGPDGAVYAGATDEQGLVRIDAAGALTPVALSGVPLLYPVQAAFTGDGTALIADTSTTLKRLGKDGAVTVAVGKAPEATTCRTGLDPARERLFGFGPLAFDAKGRILFADYFGTNEFTVRIRALERAGGATTLSDHPAGCAGGRFASVVPNVLLPAADGSLDFAGDEYVLRYAPGDAAARVLAGTGTRGGDGGPDGLAVHAQVDGVKALARDGAGRLFVLDGDPLRLSVIGADGRFTTLRRFAGRAALAAGGRGDVYVADVAEHRILFATAGVLANFALDVGDLIALAADATGSVYGVDAAGTRIVRFGADGSAVTLATDPSFAEAQFAGIARSGAIYLLTGAYPARKLTMVTPTGAVATLMGATGNFDCGVGTIEGSGDSAGVAGAIKSSLGVICEGAIYGAALRDTCDQADGKLAVVVGQVFDGGSKDGFANLVEIERACN